MNNFKRERQIVDILIEKNKNYKIENSMSIDMRSFFYKNIERPLMEFSKISLEKSYSIDFSDYENQTKFDINYISKNLDEKGFEYSWHNNEIFIMWNENFKDKQSNLILDIRKNQNCLADIKIKEYVYGEMFREVFQKECCEDIIRINIPKEFKYSDYIEKLLFVLKEENIYVEYRERVGDLVVYTFGTYNEVKIELDKYYKCNEKKISWISKLNRLFKK